MTASSGSRRFDALGWTGRLNVEGRPTLAAFLRSQAMARALIGPLAGGRKWAASHYIRQLAGVHAERRTQQRWRWLVVAPRHGDGTARAIWRRLTAGAGEWSKTGIPMHAIRYETAPGQPIIETLFLDFDDKRHADRLAAGGCSGVWLDQASDLPESALDLALAAVANYWPGALERTGPAVKRVVVTSRMPLIDHWLPRRFEEGGRDYALCRQPGGRAANAELGPQHRARPTLYQDEAAGMPQDWVRRHIDAEYGISAALLHDAAEARETIRRRLMRLAEIAAADAEQADVAA